MIVAFASGMVTGILYLIVGLLTLMAAADTWPWFDARMPQSAFGAVPVLLLWPVFVAAALLGNQVRRGRRRKAA